MPIERRLSRDGGRSDYTPYVLERDFTEEQLREEYRRMRRNLQDRVRRIERSGEFPDSATSRALSRFDAPGSLTKAQLAMQLSDIEQVLSRQTSSLSGLRRERTEMIETFHDRGYKNINKSNINDFTRFMESTRTLTLSILRYRYERGRAAGEDRNKRLELFNTAMAKGISPNALIRDFRFFVQHVDELKQLPDRKSGRKLGTKSIRRILKS